MNDVEKFIKEQKIVTPFDLKDEFDEMSTSFENSAQVGFGTENEEEILRTLYRGLSEKFHQKVMMNDEHIMKIMYLGPTKFHHMFLCHKDYFEAQIEEVRKPNFKQENGKACVFEVREYRDIEFFQKMKEKEKELNEKPFLHTNGLVHVLAGPKEYEEAVEHLESKGHDLETATRIDTIPTPNDK